MGSSMKFKRRKLEAVPPFVGMADIVFNLVLFFLILAKIQDETQLEWTPAKAAGAKPVAKARVSVTVDKDNKVYLNGKQVGMLDLSPRIAAELGDSPPGERAVLLKIHQDTLAATFEDLIAKVSEAGGEMVHVIEDERP